MKPSPRCTLQKFSSAESNERFVAYLDQFGQMAVKPVTTSQMWEYLLEEDWWYMFDNRSELKGLFERITNLFKQSLTDTGTDVFDVVLSVQYGMEQPPGAKSLTWGHHLGTTKDGYIFKAEPHGESELRFVTGFVRTITMEPLG